LLAEAGKSLLLLLSLSLLRWAGDCRDVFCDVGRRLVGLGVLGEGVGRFGVVGLGGVALNFLDKVQHLII